MAHGEALLRDHRPNEPEEGVDRDPGNDEERQPDHRAQTHHQVGTERQPTAVTGRIRSPP